MSAKVMPNFFDHLSAFISCVSVNVQQNIFSYKYHNGMKKIWNLLGNNELLLFLLVFFFFLHLLTLQHSNLIVRKKLFFCFNALYE